MKILVCFKIVPDLDMMPEGGWEPDGRLGIDTSCVRNLVNVYDESALELALRLRDHFAKRTPPAAVTLTALTVAGAHCEPILKNLRALRFDRTLCVDCGDCAPSAEETSRILAAFILREPQDLVLVGRQAGLGDSGKTPYLLAETLQWPLAGQVLDLTVSDSGGLVVQRQIDGGILRSPLKTPAVAAIGNAPNLSLRFPTLRDKMTHGRNPVEALPLATLLPGDSVRAAAVPELIALEKIERRRAGQIIVGGSPAEKARELYENHLKPRMDKLRP